MSRVGAAVAGLGAFASRAVVGVSVAALVAATAVCQVGVLAGARAALGDRPVLGWAGLFAALGITQAIVYGTVILASVGPAVRRLAAARGGAEPPASAADEVRLRLRLWLVAWAVAAMALRAALAHGVGVAALLASP